MDSLYVIRERMQDLYSRYSIVADKAIQFVLAVMTFYMINNNVGFMKTLASPVVALALAIIATFFPPIITVILATALILVHMYSVSIAALVVISIDFPDHVYFLSSFYTEDGNRCTFDTTGICT